MQLALTRRNPHGLVPGDDDRGWRGEALASVRSPRLGKPEDMVAMVAFLFSDDAAFINGQSFLVDGGAHFS
ncbi:SDR family oxidoreductase [Streptomyces sp. NPDC002596]